MSEILLYKGQQCIAKLNESAKNVLNEMQKLDQNSESTFEDINRIFQEIINVIDKRRQELLNSAKKTREDKRAVLRDQLKLIELEKAKLETECSGFKCQVEVRNVNKQINDLKNKLESIDLLMDPKENCFLRFEHLQNSAIDGIQEYLTDFGSIRTSNTFPSLCIANIGRCSANLKSSATVITYDYNGQKQKYGGDPICVTLTSSQSKSTVPCKINDNRDGTYDIQFVPRLADDFTMEITIFGRPIKNYPLKFSVSEHINPLCIYGCRGWDQYQFTQPTSLAVNDQDGSVYVLDTGNGRIQKLHQNQCSNSPFNFIDYIEGNGLENRAATGIAIRTKSNSLLVTNWRNKDIKEFSYEGKLISKFSHVELREPTCIAVNKSGDIMVADNDLHAVFVFHSNGELNFKITSIKTSAGKVDSFGVIGGVCFHPESENIIIADSRILVFSPSGVFEREINGDTSKVRGQYCGITMDNNDQLLALRSDKNRSVILVIDYLQGVSKYMIDSNDAKLKRPSCVCTTNDDHIIVADLGNDCIKKYRYC